MASSYTCWSAIRSRDAPPMRSRQISRARSRSTARRARPRSFEFRAHRSFTERSVRGRVGSETPSAATLARAEPLTTLPRSARSRVSLSLAEAACGGSLPTLLHLDLQATIGVRTNSLREARAPLITQPASDVFPIVRKRALVLRTGQRRRTAHG